MYSTLELFLLKEKSLNYKYQVEQTQNSMFLFDKVFNKNFHHLVKVEQLKILYIKFVELVLQFVRIYLFHIMSKFLHYNNILYQLL